MTGHLFLVMGTKGKYPEILKRERVGEEAQKLFDHAQELLELIINENAFTCDAVVGLWPANSRLG